MEYRKKKPREHLLKPVKEVNRVSRAWAILLMDQETQVSTQPMLIAPIHLPYPYKTWAVKSKSLLSSK